MIVKYERTAAYICPFCSNLTKKKISAFAEEKFGKKLGGYAQQYLFFYARENKLGLGD